MNPTRTKPIFLDLFLAGAFVVFGAAPVCAQQPQTQIQRSAEQPPLEAKTELVKLDVSVLNPHGDFVDGLNQESFRVLDNRTQRPVVFFSPVAAPAKVVVILETSPAVYFFQDEHLAATFALFEGLSKDDEVALVTYSDVPKEAASFTTDKAQLFEAMKNVQFTVGASSLNLYDSVSAVVDGLRRFPGKKAIVLLTTGLDSSTPDRLVMLRDKLREADVVVFAVGLGGSLGDSQPKQPKPSKKSKRNPEAGDNDPSPLVSARASLAQLSLMTGGRAYVPKSADDFVAAYREIASAVRHEYVLGIAPEHDGQAHALHVDVVESAGKPKKKGAQQEYQVFARDGYLAPGQ